MSFVDETMVAIGKFVTDFTWVPVGTVIVESADEWADTSTCESEDTGVPECKASRPRLLIGIGHSNHATTEMSEHSIGGDRVMPVS